MQIGLSIGERGDDPEIDANRTLNIELYDNVAVGAGKGFEGVYTDDYLDRKKRIRGVQYWVDTDLVKYNNLAHTFNKSLSIAVETIRNTRIEKILT